MASMSSTINANRLWFSSGRTMGDKQYELYKNKDLYLIRQTNMWSDMFGQKEKLFWIANRINKKTHKIEERIKIEFDTKEELIEYLDN